MRNRFLIILGFACVLSFVVGLRALNDFLAEDFVSLRPFLSQVSPGPNQTLYFVSPSTGVSGVNDTFVVELRMGTSAGVTSIAAYLNFDPALLSVTNISTVGSEFAGFFWEQTSTSSQVKLQASKPLPGFIGNNGLIASITFRAAGAGIANLAYDASSLALKSDDSNILNIAGSTTGSYTIDGTPPSRPASVSYSPNPSTGAHTVSWSGASDSGGSTIASYDVQRSADGGGSWDGAATGVTGTSFAESSSIPDGTYIYRVRATDNVGNTGDYSLNTNTVLVDKTAPAFVQGSVHPTGTLPAGTTSVTLQVATTEGATCKYAVNSDSPYDVMPNTFTTTGGATTAHTHPVSGLADGNTYSYYVRCSDALGNKNSVGTLIEFSIGSPPSAPPLRSNSQPAGTLAYTATQATLSIETDEQATCRYAAVADTLYSNMPVPNSFTMGSQLPNNNFPHTRSVSVTAGTSYTFYVRCIDTTGNPNNTDAPISFQVAANPDVNPPSRSKPEPSGTLAVGTTQATLSIETDEQATCRYSGTANTAYVDMSQNLASTANQDGTFGHSAQVSGLSNGNSYTYYVRCSDASGKTNDDDFSVQFSVASPPASGGGTSPSPAPTPPAGGLKGDCNGDTRVNIFDLSVLISNWKKTTTACDLNGDRTITIVDLSMMLSNWTK